MALVSLAPTGPQVAPANVVGAVLTKWPHAVYMKQTWDADWVYMPYVRAISARWAAFPGKSTAQLRFDYGEILREGRATYFDYAQLANHDYFICITAVPEDMAEYVLWVGVVPAHAFKIQGTKVSGTIAATSGDEMLTAHGFEYLLERRQVIGGLVFDAGESPDTAKRIGWAPTFNERHPRGAALLGNRSATKIEIGPPPVLPVSYGFGNALEGDIPYRWSARDIIEYVLYWSAPAGTVEPGFILEGPDQEPYDLIGYLDELYSVVRQEGRTAWDILKTVLDRRRGIAAYLVPSLGSDGFPDGTKPISLFAFSMSDAPSRVGGFVFPGNPWWLDITLDEGLTLESAVVEIDALNTYDTIVVEGDRVISCFSAEVIDSGTGRAPLEPAWPDADETAYDAADDDERARRKDRWERVYRMFRLPDDFDWSGTNAFNPSFDDDGNIDLTIVAPFWNVMHRLLEWLPIPASAAVGAESVVPGMTKPLVFCEKFGLAPGEGATGKWVWVEAPPLVDGKKEFEAARVTVHDREGLLEIRHETNHYLARNHFDSDPAGDDAIPPPVFDFERMVATIAVEADSVPRVQVTTQVTGGLIGRTLRIHVPGVQVWIVAIGGTATGLNADGTLSFYTGNGIARDDTDQLRAVAALAKSIYGKRRAAIRATEFGLWAIADLGTMIRAVTTNQGQTLVNAAVTEIRWDFVRATTTIQTGFLDLDTRRIR